MTPKEKAQELVDKYSKELEHIARIADEWSMSEFSEFRQIIAVKCASLAVDEILKSNEDWDLEQNIWCDTGFFGDCQVYWIAVKQELQKL